MMFIEDNDKPNTFADRMLASIEVFFVMGTNFFSLLLFSITRSELKTHQQPALHSLFPSISTKHFNPFRLSGRKKGGYFPFMPSSRKASGSSDKRRKATLTEIFGHIVRERRHELGMTQAELEGDEDFHQTYLSKLEIGKLEPRLSAIIHLEEKLRFPPGELIRLVPRCSAERLVIAAFKVECNCSVN